MTTNSRAQVKHGLNARRWLFLVGLVIFILGQIMINLGRDFVDRLQPIDFAHWLLLAGAVLLIPYVADKPRTRINWIAFPTLIIGITGVIGMCVIDFIVWSYEPGDARQSFIQHLFDTPAIWMPFMTIGPWLFGLGLALASLSFWQTNKWGVLLILIGSVISAALPEWFTIVAYTFIITGYVICFRSSGCPEH